MNKVNYRPVSLLIVISKIYKYVIFGQVSDDIDPISEDLLCALHKRYSCQSTLIKAIDDWKISLDRNQMTGAVFMDLLKAFSFAKIHVYGLSLNACDHFSYRCNRFQRVNIMGCHKKKTSYSEGIYTWALIV